MPPSAFMLSNPEQWTECEKLMLFNIQLFCPELTWDEKTNYFNGCCKQLGLSGDRTKASITLQWQELKRARLIREDQDGRHSVSFP